MKIYVFENVVGLFLGLKGMMKLLVASSGGLLPLTKMLVRLVVEESE